MLDPLLLAEARRAIESAQRIVVVSHIRPDGDAVGSLLGMGLALQAAGKQTQMILADGVPSSFRHLMGSSQVRQRLEGEFDLLIVVDCSEFERAGDELPDTAEADINFDHHITNTLFARINLVKPDAVATAEILASCLPALGLPITQPVASALLTGLITDTIGFRTSNMSASALRTAADLVEYGCDLPGLYQQALLTRSFQAMRYWGAGLTKLTRERRLAWTTLSLADRKSVEYSGRDDADLINVLSAIDGIDVAVIFVEQNNAAVKVSWRSKSGIDVSQIAVQFGGGGHKAASGADIPGNLEEVREKVLNATRGLL